jgi:MOSC domain-containing protein YiiM
MLTGAQLAAAWAGRGVVRAICLRQGAGRHHAPARATLTVDGGLVGDRWATGEAPDRGDQVTLMNATVADLIAHVGHPGLDAGDNFFVDMDLSEAALPIGTVIRLGTALMKITPKPHTGCKKFRARFGLEALKWINAPENKALRLRGLHAEVLEPGEVAVGDAVVVV